MLLLAAIFGMMLASWRYGVAEGFYGRVFGQIRSGRVALILLVLRHNIGVTSGNLVFSRGLYETVGPFAAYRMCHDWDFLIRCMVHVEPIFVPGAHLRYRTHPTNTLKSTGNLMHGEGSAALKTYLALIARGNTTNRLAPTPENWPVYFRFFTETYAPWFTGQPIDTVARQLFSAPATPPSWLLAPPDSAESGGYLTQASAKQAALALRRVVSR